MRQNIVIENKKEADLIQELENRTDVTAERIKRLLKLPDLTKKENSPVKILFDQIINLPRFQDFDLVEFPKIVTVEENFDLLNTPADHPSRKKTDTYYITDKDILRTQMTDMWSFYLKDLEILERLKKEGQVGALSRGIVFRKDEIDRNHFPAFHQVDALYLCRRSDKVITQKDLEEVQIDLAQSVFGSQVEYKFLVDSFPFTDPSVEMNIKFNDQWLEVSGAGLVHPQVLQNFGIDSEIYNGWAFGFGDRLAMVKMAIPDIRILWSNDPRITSQFKDIDSQFKEVSKYPPITRDISFVVSQDFVPNNYFDLIRDEGEDLIEEVKLIDKYENEEKFGQNKVSYTYRIIYRSNTKTLLAEKIDKIQKEIYTKTASQFQAELR